MRIISGKYKGIKIQFLKNSFTRPLKDSVKENIFNILEHSKKNEVKIKKANILDLYSGIGSFGLECLSRGAKKVTFIENNPEAAKYLKQNLSKLSLSNETLLFEREVGKFLSSDFKEKFEIFFFDPPFASKDFLENLKLINIKKIFTKNHIVIIHRERNENDNFSKFFKPILIKKYGRSKVIFGVFI